MDKTESTIEYLNRVYGGRMGWSYQLYSIWIKNEITNVEDIFSDEHLLRIVEVWIKKRRIESLESFTHFKNQLIDKVRSKSLLTGIDLRNLVKRLGLDEINIEIESYEKELTKEIDLLQKLTEGSMKVSDRYKSLDRTSMVNVLKETINSMKDIWRRETEIDRVKKEYSELQKKYYNLVEELKIRGIKV